MVLKRSFLGLFLLLSLLFVGCSTSSRPIVPVPASLEAASLMEVKRTRLDIRSNPLRFGEWQVVGFDRKGFPGSRRHSFGTDDVTFSWSRGWAAYSFRLASAAASEEWECDCRFRRKDRSAGLGAPGEALEVTLTYEDSLLCVLYRPGDDEPWKLEVNGSLFIGGKGYSGTLAHGSRVLTLEPANRIEGGLRLPGPPLAYVFVREGEEIGSTELIRPGYVRIGDWAGEDREVVATASAALLLLPTGF